MSKVSVEISLNLRYISRQSKSHDGVRFRAGAIGAETPAVKNAILPR